MRLQTRAHRLFFPLTRYIYKHADAVVVYGEHVKRYLMGEDVPAQRIFIAAHAVNNEDYNCSVSADEKAALLQRLNIAPQQKMILYLGRLEEIKGLRYLLDAFASLHRQDAVLVLAGAGTERAKLEQMTHELGIAEQVRFVGYVAPSETILYYAAAWIYLLPSVTMPHRQRSCGDWWLTKPSIRGCLSSSQMQSAQRLAAWCKTGLTAKSFPSETAQPSRKRCDECSMIRSGGISRRSVLGKSSLAGIMTRWYRVSGKPSNT